MPSKPKNILGNSVSLFFYTWNGCYGSEICFSILVLCSVNWGNIVETMFYAAILPLWCFSISPGLKNLQRVCVRRNIWQGMNIWRKGENEKKMCNSFHCGIMYCTRRISVKSNFYTSKSMPSFVMLRCFYTVRVSHKIVHPDVQVSVTSVFSTYFNVRERIVLWNRVLKR